MRISDYSLQSKTGWLRPFNEDAVRMIESAQVCMVADGMGSDNPQAPSGTKALDSIEAHISLDIPIEQALEQAHHRFVASLAPHEDQLGACVVLAQIPKQGNDIAFAWLGDCRGYVLKDGDTIQATQDHTQVQRWIDEGLVDPQTVNTHPYRNVLTQALGVEQDAPVEVGSAMIEVVGPTRVLLCSDGLSDFLTLAEINKQMKNGSCEDAASALIASALNAGSGDDLSVIVLDIVQ